MNIKLIEILTDDEDFGPYLHFEIPEAEFNGFINIGSWYYEVCDFYTESFFMDKYHDDLMALVEKWIADGGLLEFTSSKTLPKWSDLDPLAYNLIDSYRFEMGFVTDEDYNGDKELFEDRCKAFDKAIEKFPELSNVITVADEITLFGDCASYVNWWGYIG